MEVSQNPIPVNHNAQSLQTKLKSHQLTINLLPSDHVSEQVIDSLAEKTLKSLVERQIMFVEISRDI